MSRLTLNRQDLDTVKSAVQRAESGTSGEIVTAVVGESADYGTFEWIFSIIGGFLYFFVAMFFSDSLQESLMTLSWQYSPRHLLLFYGISTLLVIVLLYMLANSRWVDRLVVPRKIMTRKVRERAMRHFAEAGVFNTRDRTGILLFISELEQRVELIADRGINARIKQEQWNQIVTDLVTGIRSGRGVDAICQALEKCGELLSRYFPIKPDDTDELANDLSVLEK